MRRRLFLGAVVLAFCGVTSAAETVYDVTTFGAKGDGATQCTAAVQKAIDRCTADGGGTVVVPRGTFLTGSIFLKNNVDLYLMPGSVLLGSPDKADYNPLDVCPQNSGYAPESSFGAHLVLAIEQRNVTVRGPGRIDGNSPAFLLDAHGEHYSGQGKIPWRPSQMLYFVECENVRVQDIDLHHSPYWSLFLHGCRHVFVRGVNIHTERNPHTYNGDGIDVDCSQYVSISDCHIDTADDCITLRANGSRLKNPQPCRYVTVTNCVLSTPCNCVRVGVGDGQIRDAVFSNLVIENARTAFNFFSSWTAQSRGVDIRNIRFENVTVDCQRLVHVQYGHATETTIRDLYFTGISGTVERESLLVGKPRLPLRNIHLGDWDVQYAGAGPGQVTNANYGNIHAPSKGPSAGNHLEATHVDGLVLRDVRFAAKDANLSPQVVLRGVTHVESERCMPPPTIRPVVDSGDRIRDY